MAEYMKRKLGESRGSFDRIDPSKEEASDNRGVHKSSDSGPFQHFKEIIGIGGAPETRFARRFEVLGMANLLNLQININNLEKDLGAANSENAGDIFERLMGTLQDYSKCRLITRNLKTCAYVFGRPCSPRTTASSLSA